MPLCITIPNRWKVGSAIELEFEHQSLSDSSIGVWRFEVILETLPVKNPDKEFAVNLLRWIVSILGNLSKHIEISASV